MLLICYLDSDPKFLLPGTHHFVTWNTSFCYLEHIILFSWIQILIVGSLNPNRKLIISGSIGSGSLYF